jgi:hypothetical protein
MDELQRSWFELKFRDTFRSSDGTGFQNFFSDLMEKRYPADFQRVKPNGSLGDRKCDGYHASLKLVYQLYGELSASEHDLSSGLLVGSVSC